MRRTTARFVGLVGLLVLTVSAGKPPVTSSRRESASRSRPKRIASVMLATDEILFELVGPKRLVAISAYADDGSYSNVAGRYPKRVRRIRGEIEAIIGVRPDLVCVSKFNTADFMKLLERSGLRFHRYERLHTFAEIRQGILKLGTVVGEPERARQIVDRMDAKLAAVRKRLKGITSRPRVLHWSGGWTTGAGSTLDDIITAAGGRNAAAELGMKGPVEVRREQVLKLAPDYILVSARPQDMSLGAIGDDPVLKRLRAVRLGRIIRVPAPALLAISQYVVDAVEPVAKQLHPDRFKAAATQETHTR